MNYRNQDLTGQDFSNQDLQYCNFRGANLTNCNFEGADLAYANLREANIEGANFTNAKMHYSNARDAAGTANWTGAKIHMSPKWLDMPGADDVTKAPSYASEENRRAVITAFITQAMIPLNDHDQQVVREFMDQGTRGVVTGTYGEMPDAHKLYEVLHEEAPKEIAYMLNAVMDQDITYENDEYNY